LARHLGFFFSLFSLVQHAARRAGLEKRKTKSFQEALLFLCFPRYKEEYKRFLQSKDTKEMINTYKNVMDYLTDHTGKLIDDTAAVFYLYNLLKEEVGDYLSNDVPSAISNHYLIRAIRAIRAIVCRPLRI